MILPWSQDRVSEKDERPPSLPIAAQGGERGGDQEVRDDREADGRGDGQVPGAEDRRHGARLPRVRQGPGQARQGRRRRLAHRPPQAGVLRRRPSQAQVTEKMTRRKKNRKKK